MELISVLPDLQDPNRKIIEGQLWMAGKVVPPRQYKCPCCSEPIFYHEQFDEMQKTEERLNELRMKENRTSKEQVEMTRLDFQYEDLKSKLNTMLEEMESGLGEVEVKER